LPKYPDAPAIIEVKCSQALVDEVTRLGGRPVFYRTGHSLIKAKMKELHAPFTGEMSGHIFFADEYYGYDDAFYAAGRLLRLLSQASEPLSAMVERLPRYHSTAETRVPCPDEEKFRVVEKLQDYFRGKHQVIDVDGVRVLFGDGWGLVRASNTQPVLVARCEAKTPERLQEITGIMKGAMEEFPQVSPFQWEY
jgi:phosphomannomutase/phosphoglucomutase